MVRILTANNPALFFVAIFLSIIFHISAWFYVDDISFLSHHNEPLSRLLWAEIFPHFFSPKLLFLILNFLFQLGGAWIFNDMINNQKFISRKSYIFAMLYVICSSLNLTWLFFSPFTFLLFLSTLSFSLLFTLSKQERFYTQLFDLGSLYALSSLLYFPSCIIFLFSLFGLYSLRPFILIEFLRILLGILTIMISAYSLYILFNFSDQFLPHLLNNAHSTLFYTNWLQKIHIPAIGITILVSLFYLIVPISKNIKTRKLIGLFSLLAILICVSFLIPSAQHHTLFCLTTPIISFLLGHILIEYKHRFMPNIIFAVFINTIILSIVLNL
jgi:hypothetical protein